MLVLQSGRPFFGSATFSFCSQFVPLLAALIHLGVVGIFPFFGILLLLMEGKRTDPPKESLATGVLSELFGSTNYVYMKVTGLGGKIFPFLCIYLSQDNKQGSCSGFFQSLIPSTDLCMLKNLTGPLRRASKTP